MSEKLELLKPYVNCNVKYILMFQLRSGARLGVFTEALSGTKDLDFGICDQSDSIKTC